MDSSSPRRRGSRILAIGHAFKGPLGPGVGPVRAMLVGGAGVRVLVLTASQRHDAADTDHESPSRPLVLCVGACLQATGACALSRPSGSRASSLLQTAGLGGAKSTRCRGKNPGSWRRLSPMTEPRPAQTAFIASRHSCAHPSAPQIRERPPLGVGVRASAQTLQALTWPPSGRWPCPACGWRNPTRCRTSSAP